MQWYSSILIGKKSLIIWSVCVRIHGECVCIGWTFWSWCSVDGIAKLSCSVALLLNMHVSRLCPNLLQVQHRFRCGSEEVDSIWCRGILPSFSLPLVLARIGSLTMLFDAATSLLKVVVDDDALFWRVMKICLKLSFNFWISYWALQNVSSNLDAYKPRVLKSKARVPNRVTSKASWELARDNFSIFTPTVFEQGWRDLINIQVFHDSEYMTALYFISFE